MCDAIRSFKVYFKFTKELIDDGGERGRRYCASKMLEWGVPLRWDVVLISEPLMNLR